MFDLTKENFSLSTWFHSSSTLNDPTCPVILSCIPAEHLMRSKKTVVQLKIKKPCLITANTLEGGMNLDWHPQMSGTLLHFAYSTQISFTDLKNCLHRKGPQMIIWSSLSWESKTTWGFLISCITASWKPTGVGTLPHPWGGCTSDQVFSWQKIFIHLDETSSGAICTLSTPCGCS